MFDQIIYLAKEACRHGEPVADENASPKALKIAPEDIASVCSALRENPSMYFDMLSCITGIDNGPEAGTMEIAYNLYSIPYDLHLMLKVTLPREKAVIDTVTTVWRTADWQEREIFDMYGVVFKDHPDLRRILMPADWEGYPLRKDYKLQEYYRNIKVEY